MHAKRPGICAGLSDHSIRTEFVFARSVTCPATGWANRIDGATRTVYDLRLTGSRNPCVRLSRVQLLIVRGKVNAQQCLASEEAAQNEAALWLNILQSALQHCNLDRIYNNNGYSAPARVDVLFC